MRLEAFSKDIFRARATPDPMRQLGSFEKADVSLSVSVSQLGFLLSTQVFTLPAVIRFLCICIFLRFEKCTPHKKEKIKYIEAARVVHTLLMFILDRVLEDS